MGSSDPYDLLNYLKAVLKFSDGYRRDGLRGYCAVINRIRYVVINSKQPTDEKRVVSCHEGGHLILHSDELKAGAMRDFDVYNIKGRLEREANFFAADFLLDDDEVLDLMHSDEADFFRVAKALRIPAPFFAFKLYSMVSRGYNMSVPIDLNSTFLK